MRVKMRLHEAVCVWVRQSGLEGVRVRDSEPGESTASQRESESTRANQSEPEWSRVEQSEPERAMGELRKAYYCMSSVTHPRAALDWILRGKRARRAGGALGSRDCLGREQRTLWHLPINSIMISLLYGWLLIYHRIIPLPSSVCNQGRLIAG